MHGTFHKLNIQILNARSRILLMEHPDRISAMGNLPVTYKHKGKYTEAKKLEIQVLDAMIKTLGVQHSDTIIAMGNLGKYTEAEKLEAQAQAHELKRRVCGAESPHTITPIANIQETQDIQVFHAILVIIV